MTINHISDSTSRKPLRLWPGMILAVLLALVSIAAPSIFPDARPFGAPIGILAMMTGAFVGGAIVVWWVFFSRARWFERLGALGLMVVAAVAMRPLLHESMGTFFYFFGSQSMSLALVAWAMASRRLSGRPRHASMIVTILLACGTWALVRTGGMNGEGHSDFHWRWTPTVEERLVAQAGEQPNVIPSPPVAASDQPAAATPAPTTAPVPVAERIEPAAPGAAETPAEPAMSERGIRRVEGLAMSERGIKRVEWPGFRGPARDGSIRGVRIATDWSQSPPVEIWRRPIGPGWSSFAVQGDVFYTQEQRGDDETVSAYSLKTGAPLWRHRDAARFWEAVAGAGPRATPALDRGRVYTVGATGIVNALNARDGSVVWSRNAASDTGARDPGWGFTSSPLVIDDLVIVATSGRLVAYELATGHPRWVRRTHGGSYSSPHLLTVDGVAHILMLNGGGATGVAPADGTELWDHRWPESSGNIVQPTLTADGDVLIGATDQFSGGFGTRRIAVAHGPAAWTVEERWTTRGLKSGFSDYVVHKGHAYGFDGTILACIELESGARKWKGGRYGHGQLVLLPDQDVLLVLSEDGQLALVSATPDTFTELAAKVPAIEGKTWNHPVLVGDLLLVRNGEEMAAFRLSLAGSKKDTIEEK